MMTSTRREAALASGRRDSTQARVLFALSASSPAAGDENASRRETEASSSTNFQSRSPLRLVSGRSTPINVHSLAMLCCVGVRFDRRRETGRGEAEMAKNRLESSIMHETSCFKSGFFPLFQARVIPVSTRRVKQIERAELELDRFFDRQFSRAAEVTGWLAPKRCRISEVYHKSGDT